MGIKPISLMVEQASFCNSSPLLLLNREAPRKIPIPKKSKILRQGDSFAGCFWRLGGLAQLVERLICIQKVRSSNLLASISAVIAQWLERDTDNVEVPSSSLGSRTLLY